MRASLCPKLANLLPVFADEDALVAVALDVDNGVDVDEDGNILIADSGNERVQICDMEGYCEYLLSAEGEPVEFGFPLDVAFGSDNRLIVTDFDRRGYYVCKQLGECSFYPGPDEFITVDHEDRVLMMAHERFYMCDYEGNCEWTFGDHSWTDEPGSFNSSWDLTTDESGRIFIAEKGRGRIQICYEEGLCHAFYIHRPTPQLMWWPAGMN